MAAAVGLFFAKIPFENIACLFLKSPHSGSCCQSLKTLFLFMPSFDEQLWAIVAAAMKEDLGEDHSTLACIPADARGIATLKIKESGILAGVEVAEKIFRMKEPSAILQIYKKDGVRVEPGERAFDIRASVHTILECERLVLNCMQRMSAIATLTRQFVDKVKSYHAKILDTRKTTPNFRLLEKEAVRIGGGANHRYGLYDMILLKDNHIDYCGGIENAINRACEYVQNIRPGLEIEIETRSLDEVRKVIAVGGVHRIMLDNFGSDQVAEAVKLIGGRYETDASGGVSLDNVEEYAKTGVDFISVGALIHQARSLDMSLKAFVN
jgi:nicotinate-nucleotide pyrophosphorylase (carboxylating)